LEAQDKGGLHHNHPENNSTGLTGGARRSFRKFSSKTVLPQPFFSKVSHGTLLPEPFSRISRMSLKLFQELFFSKASTGTLLPESFSRISRKLFSGTLLPELSFSSARLLPEPSLSKAFIGVFLRESVFRKTSPGTCSPEAFFQNHSCPLLQ